MVSDSLICGGSDVSACLEEETLDLRLRDSPAIQSHLNLSAVAGFECYERGLSSASTSNQPSRSISHKIHSDRAVRPYGF